MAATCPLGKVILQGYVSEGRLGDNIQTESYALNEPAFVNGYSVHVVNNTPGIWDVAVRASCISVS